MILNFNTVQLHCSIQSLQTVELAFSKQSLQANQRDESEKELCRLLNYTIETFCPNHGEWIFCFSFQTECENYCTILNTKSLHLPIQSLTGAYFISKTQLFIATQEVHAECRLWTFNAVLYSHSDPYLQHTYIPIWYLIRHAEGAKDEAEVVNNLWSLDNFPLPLEEVSTGRNLRFQYDRFAKFWISYSASYLQTASFE